MTQIEKARLFHDLHQREKPLILYNVWDVATAKVVEACDAKAIATGSWSVAASHGYDDGQNLPFGYLTDLASALVRKTDLPVSIDFEGGYAETDSDLRSTFMSLIETGIVGINFEDQIIGGNGLVPLDVQVRRIEILASVVQATRIPVFINARTDIFLQTPESDRQTGCLDEALARANAYADAGASGVFVPGLSQADLVGEICANSALPVNVMVDEDKADVALLTRLGVKRISFGPAPFLGLMTEFEARAGRVYTSS